MLEKGNHLFGKRLKNHIFGFTWHNKLMQTIKYYLFKENIFLKNFHDASITFICFFWKEEPFGFSYHEPLKGYCEKIVASSDWLKLVALCFARKVYLK